MKRKYLLLLTVCCSCLLATFICSGCNNRDSSQKHTDVKNHTSAKETVKPYSDFKYADHFNRSNLSLTDRSIDRKSTRLNSSHRSQSRMPSSA